MSGKAPFHSLALRLSSAVLALAIFFTALYFSPLGLTVLTSLAVFVLALEYYQLTLTPIANTRSLVFFLLAVFGVYSNAAFGTTSLVGLSLVLWICLMCFILVRANHLPNLSEVARLQGLSTLGLVYCGLTPALATNMIAWADRGSLWLVTLLAIVFVGDTGAYFVGVSMGKKKLFPLLSPNKTVEGAIGGLASALLAGVCAWFLFFRDIPAFFIIFLSLLTSVFAQLGDLFESQLKRAANAKDSGQLMPGHGGLLDRLDGVLFALPIFYTFALFIHAFV